MTLLINHSFESTNYSNNNDSSLLVSNDRDYTMDRKVLQFNRLSKALKVCYLHSFTYLNNPLLNSIFIFFSQFNKYNKEI